MSYRSFEQARNIEDAVDGADPDHGISHPADNPEAVLLRENARLRAENEQLKIKLSRMCGDA